MLYESKEVTVSIKGKDDYVSTNSIQRHKSYRDMIFINLSNNYFIFCQDDHPLYIDRGNKEIEVEACDLDIETDKIWVDNSIVYNSDDIQPTKSPQEVIDEIILVNNSEVEVDSKYIKGNTSNYRLNPQFIKYDKKWLTEFINIIYDINLEMSGSYNFVQQLRLICSRIGYSIYIIPLLFNNKLVFVFSINSLEEDDNKVGYISISNIVKVNEYNDYLYDIKTSSNEFMLGCVQNHNSFHVGGAVSLMSIDIVDKEVMGNLDDELKPKIEKLVKQVEDDLMMTSDFLMIRLDKDNYKNDPYTIDEDPKDPDIKIMTLPVGYFEMEFRDIKADITIEQETKLYMYDDIEEDDRYISIIYGKGHKLFTVKPIVKDYTKLAQVMDRNVGGKSPWGNDPSKLYLKFMKSLYVFDEPYDSIHMEVLISNIMRSSKDPRKPARLSIPYDPKLYSIKTLPSIISWPLGLGFENFSAALRSGMIADRSPSSPIEKVMFGESLLTTEQKAKIKK